MKLYYAPLEGITNYNEVLKSDTFTLHKLKEIWMYVIDNFPQEKKLIKAVKKSNNLADFMRAVYAFPEL